MEEALEKVAASLAENNKIEEQSKKQLILEVLNYYSNQKDKQSKTIEIGLYFSLERYFPKQRLVLESDTLEGISTENTIFIKGTYQQIGEITILRLQALDGLLTGELLAQADVEFITQKKVTKTLIAVLDLEAETLGENQRKLFSDIFRSSLIEKNVFNVVSSADVDQMDPDAIQEEAQCTRDECATIIGEQLGVDRVISTTYRKLTDSIYYLSGKIIDIEDGVILISKRVKHDGDISTLDMALEKLARKLTEGGKLTQEIESVTTAEPILPLEIVEPEDDSWPWWYYAIAGAIIAGAAAISGDDSGDSGSSNSSGGDTGGITVSW